MNQVRIWEETVTIPTYEVGEPDKNPMFLEKRVYQGSSGRYILILPQKRSAGRRLTKSIRQFTWKINILR